MFKNYLKITIRNLVKFKFYTIISIASLAIGMASFLMISLYVYHELSYDQFNKKADRIFRLIFEDISNGKNASVALLPSAYATDLQNEFPQIIKAVRVTLPFNAVLNNKNHVPFRTNDFIFADSTLLDVFTFHMIQGNPKSALNEPFSLIITRSVANKFFGNENPIGKIIRFDNKFNFNITGVIEDMSSIAFHKYTYNSD